VSAAMNLEVILPLKDDVVACIEGLFTANKAVQPMTSSAGSAPAVGTFKPGVKGTGVQGVKGRNSEAGGGTGGRADQHE